MVLALTLHCVFSVFIYLDVRWQAPPKSETPQRAMTCWRDEKWALCSGCRRQGISAKALEQPPDCHRGRHPCHELILPISPRSKLTYHCAVGARAGCPRKQTDYSLQPRIWRNTPFPSPCRYERVQQESKIIVIELLYHM